MSHPTFKSCLAWLFLYLLLEPPEGAALQPERAMTQYSRAVWQVEEGLPQNTVRAIAQTPDGFLWFGTQAGLVRFDGVRFSVHDRRTHGDVFDNHHVYALEVDQEGTLWVGTNGGGLVRLVGGELRRYSLPGGLPTGRITALEASEPEGTMWIGTYGGGLVRVKDGEATLFDSADGLSHDVVFDLDSDARGGLWIATYGGGVSHFDGARFDLTLDTSSGLAHNGVFAVHQAPGGDLWIGTNAGLNRYRSGEIELYTTVHGLSHERILSLESDRDGLLWVGTYGAGLNRMLGDTFSHLERRHGFPSDNVWTLFEDREGTLWSGTLGGGLVQLKDGPFTTYSVTEGLSSEVPSSLHEGPDGVLWVGTRNRGLNRFGQGVTGPAASIEYFTTANGLAGDNVWTLAGGPDGDLWVGTTGSGLSHWHDGRWEHYTIRDGLAGDSVFSLMVASGGEVWIGTNRGANRLRDGRFELFTTEQGLASNQVRTFLEDRQGRIWMGTTEGVSVWDGTGFISYTTADGLASGNVWTLHEDADGVMWMGTFGGGLHRFKDGRITAVTTREGLFDDDLTTVLEDDFGFLWIGSSRGIFRVARNDLNDFAEGRSKEFDYVAYGRRDGLKNADCYGGDRPGLKTRDGRLWFTTLDGVAVVDPATVAIRPAPAALVEKVVLDMGTPIRRGESLPHDTKSFDFHFTASTLAMSDKVRLRYRLEGFDDNWRHAAVKQRNVVYNNLRPGPYTFEVMASDEVGRWTGRPAAFSFVITPAFYQTPIFLVLCGLSAALGALGLHHLRVARLRRREKELTERVEDALAHVKVLRGLLPICSSCRKIRDDAGYWQELETFIGKHSEASFSHGVCPGCARKLYPDYFGAEEL